MGRFRPAAIAGVVALAAALALAAQDVIIRSNVRLVRLLATVKDRNGQVITNLGKSDFQIFDNGVEQQVSVFESQTSQPLSISLLIDTSGSTAKELKTEIDSVQRFLKAVFESGNPEDAVALYSFNWEVRMLTGFTRRSERLEKALRQLKAEAGTSLYDAIFLATRELEGREGRHVMLVVTDGGDTTSSKNYHQALQALHNADTPLYPILIMPITNDPGRNIGGENALTGLSNSTGGRVFAPSVGPDLDEAFREILRDLRTQYLIGYYPRNVPLSKDRFHRLELKTRRRDLHVITRTGYYGDFDDTAAAIPNLRVIPRPR